MRLSRLDVALNGRQFFDALLKIQAYAGRRPASFIERLPTLTGSCRSATAQQGCVCRAFALDQWAWENGVQLTSHASKPTDNGLCESFNGSLRDECLNVNEFISIDEARRRIEAWRVG